MALKGDRKYVDDEIRFFVNQTAEEGGIVSLSTFGSGVANDHASSVAAYVASASRCRCAGRSHATNTFRFEKVSRDWS